ncbi:prostaglandin F2-alpha receptor-like [Stegostoma tigrinum]|uniref:prostaglandin F2-alpha receptor-like n=1 Tax=Stegostoma tigrinum TaxID=3053191 RepID=UPI00202B8BF1|nr:prostaglandin F2-alpha receptor-like [Stegostoma tigrinum]
MLHINIIANVSTSNATNDTCADESKSVHIPIIFMTIGILSNGVALVILVKAYKRFRQKWRASFLLFASGLVCTDCLGHIITGSITIRVYAMNKNWTRIDSSGHLCPFLGTSMVFFGLSALFLGSVMAIERCLGITQPLFHSAKVTARRAMFILGGTWLFALVIALLPNFHFGKYTVQCTRTWCFLSTKDVKFGIDSGILLLFSSLGLTALSTSFLCNTISGVALLRSHIKNKLNRQGKSHHVEMLVQLMTIMLVSCVCWGPFLVSVATIGSLNAGPKAITSLLLSVRLAAWNQILDPWVYILLRKSVLKRIWKITNMCMGRQNIRLHNWNCSSLQSTIKTAAMERSLSATKRPSQISRIS